MEVFFQYPGVFLPKCEYIRLCAVRLWISNKKMAGSFLPTALTIKNTWHFVLFLWFCIKSGYINRACTWCDFKVSYGQIVYTFLAPFLYIQNFDFLYIHFVLVFLYIHFGQIKGCFLWYIYPSFGRLAHQKRAYRRSFFYWLA